MGIHIIATGGTIASLGDPTTGTVSPGVSPERLIGNVPGLDKYGPVTFDEVAFVNGWNVTPETMAAVARRAEAALSDERIDGVVVTHGTDTVEETAFFCDVTVDSEKPIAFAAAMRSADELGADGPRNLRAAAALAASCEARGLGSVVVLDDQAHAARWVRKLDSSRVSAFGAPGHGALATVHGEVVQVLNRPSGRVVLSLPTGPLPSVPVVHTDTGMEEGIIAAVRSATGAVGLVIEGTGLGNVPGSLAPELESAVRDGLTVVVASRTVSGGTRPIYGGPGGGATLRDLGVVGAGTLTASKARLLLMLLHAAATETGEATDQLPARFCAAAVALR